MEKGNTLQAEGNGLGQDGPYGKINGWNFHNRIVALRAGDTPEDKVQAFIRKNKKKTEKISGEEKKS